MRRRSAITFRLRFCSSRIIIGAHEGDVGTEHGFSALNKEHPFRMIVFDKRIGGLGAADAIFDSHRLLIKQAVQLLSSCPCQVENRRGCPSCVLDPR